MLHFLNMEGWPAGCLLFSSIRQRPDLLPLAQQ